MRDPGLPRSIAAVRDLIDASGLALEDCLTGTRLTVRDLEGSEIQTQDEVRIAINVSRIRPDYADIGLDAGLRCRAADFGMIGVLMRSSVTFADTLTNSIAFQDLCHPLPLSSQEHVGDAVVLTMDPGLFPLQLHAILIDQQLAAIDTIRSELLEGRVVRTRSLELTCPPPPHADRYGDMFGVRPLFGAPVNRLVFDARSLREPLPTAVPEAVPQLQENCRELMRYRHARVGVTGRVLSSLERRDGPVPGLAEVAADLNVSPRSLRRLLREEGRSFRALDAEVRLARAAFLLETTSSTLDVISAELGYNAPPAFAYAFKRWTGETPGAYRRARQSSAALQTPNRRNRRPEFERPGP